MKTFIFDLEGIVFNSEQAILHLIQCCFEKEGYFQIDLQNFIGYSKAEILQAFMEITNYSVQQVETLFRDCMQEHPFVYQEMINPDTLALLEYLYQHQIICALATSSTRADLIHKFKNTELEKYFKVIVTRDDYNLAKPDSEVYLVCLDKLQLKPEQCIAIEDSQGGVDAAHNVDIQVIARTSEYEKKFENADYVMSDLKEVISMLENKQL